MFRGILDNVLSGMKAGFKAILNLFKHPNGESRMFNLKSSSKLSATLLALILGASVFMTGQVWAAEEVKDPTTGKMISAPQYGGTINFLPEFLEPLHADTWFGTANTESVNLVIEKLGIGDWGISRDKWDWKRQTHPGFAMTGLLAERFETPDPLTFIVHLRKGIHYHKKAPMNGRELIADDIVFNFHRTTGMGEFTEAGPTPHNPYANSKPFASVTAYEPIITN